MMIDTGYSELITSGKAYPSRLPVSPFLARHKLGNITKMNNGWITLHRKILQSPIFKDSQAVHLWLHLLLSANHKEGKHLVGNQMVIIPRGSLLTGRKSLSKATKINEYKIERLLKMFQSCEQIAQQTFTKFRLISITNYDQYQDIAQQTHNNCTTTAQQPHTNNNVNKDNKVNNKEKNSRFAPPSLSELKNYISEKQLSVDAENFINFYESKNWMVGKNKMKSWQASARGWHTRNKTNGGNNGNRKQSFIERVESANREQPAPILDITAHCKVVD